ncbi:MAG: polysaccharide biosynthesis protein [Erysipelotrichaceae bacterium]|nr:polysaccharide biosynthesis protein [Erysipelotrichaceae bacterium]
MNKSKAIVKQATFLAVAGIVVRIIGVLYRSPLTHMIGAEGNGYYSTAYNIYALVLMLSSYSIPTAISKLISEKLALNQYDYADKIFHCAVIYITVISGVAALLAFILAPLIVTKNAVFALRILCPTIFLSGLVGVLRGYFQAHSTTVYTSISQILEQIFNAVVSILAAWIFIQPYLNADPTLRASQGAGGSALGTGAGVLIALLFMVVMYILKGRHLVDRIDPDPYTETNRQIVQSILAIVTPIIISTCVYNLVATFDMYVFYGVVGDSVRNIKLFGVYSGEFTPLMNVPVALASAMSTATIPAISGSYALENFREVKENINSSISVTMLVLIPSAFGLATLSYPIMGLLFPQPETLAMASMVLKIGAPGVIVYGLSTLTNGILQAIGEVKVPLHNAVVSLITHLVILFVALLLLPKSLKDLSLYVLAMASTAYALQMCIMNQRALRRIVRYKMTWRRTFILPILASTIMSIVVYVVYRGLFAITHMVFIPLVVSVVAGIVVYFAIVIYLYKDHLEELNNIPMMDKITRRIFSN